MKWDDSKLLVRRSHTRGNEVIESTKTGRDQIIDLVLDVNYILAMARCNCR